MYLGGLILGSHRHRATQVINQAFDAFAWLSQIVLFVMLGLLVTPSALLGPNALIGSTVAVLIISNDQSWCLWACDSRFYRMRAGRPRQLSRDQRHVQDLVDRGEIPLKRRPRTRWPISSQI